MTTTQPKVRAEWVNPFLSPAQTVWQAMLGCDLNLEGAELVSHQFTTEDLTAVIGVSGKLEGNVLYGFGGNCAQAAVAKMMDEPEVNEIDQMGLSALGEIAPPGSGLRSSTRTSQPSLARMMAAASPLCPAPTTIASCAKSTSRPIGLTLPGPRSPLAGCGA